MPTPRRLLAPLAILLTPAIVSGCWARDNVDVSAELQKITAEIAELKKENASLRELANQRKVIVAVQGSNAVTHEQEDDVPPDLSTPEGVLRGYFSATSWVDRLPYVIDTPETREKMQAYYANGVRQATNFSIRSISEVDSSDGREVIVTVDVFGDLTDYFMVRTPEGLTIDWQKSIEGVQVKSQQKLLRTWKLENAVLQARLLKVRPLGSSTMLTIEVTNWSKAFLSSWTVGVATYDASGVFLGHGNAIGFNLQPGDSKIKDCLVSDVAFHLIASKRWALGSMTVENESKQRLPDAEKYFRLVEVK